MKNFSCVAQSILVFSFVVLTGCQTGGFPAATEISTPPSNGSGAALNGRTMGGQQPITGGSIQLYAVGLTGDGSAATPLIPTGSMTVGSSNNYYSNAGSTNGNSGCTYTTGNPNTCTALPETNSMGYFQITGDWNCTSNTATYGTNPYLYIVSTGGNPGTTGNNANISLMAALGTCSSVASTTFINIDEVTTVGSIAALYPYMTSYSSIGSGASDAQRLAAAFSAVNEYVNIATGLAPGTLATGVSYASATEINTLADSVSACVNSTGGTAGDTSGCGKLFTYATPSGGSAPSDTIGALVDILNNPTSNVTNIFNLAPSSPPFQPTLTSAPSYWTLPIIASPPTFPSALPSTGNYVVTNTSTGLAWDNHNVNTSAAAIYLQSTSSPTGGAATAQEWKFTQINPSGIYEITSLNSNIQLFINGNSIVSGGSVIQFAFGTGASNAEWTVAPVASGNGYIITSILNPSLPIDANGNAVGDALQQKTSTDGGTSQVWTLTPVSGGCSAITPQIWTSTKGWQNTSSITVPPGVEVSLGGAPTTGGSWSWTGSNNFSSSTLQNNNVPLSSGANTFTATYTNTCGSSQLTYTVVVGQPTLADAPCDILASSSNPCGAAYSVTRRMFAAYAGNLFQLSCASCSPTTMNIGSSSTTGEVNVSAATSYCSTAPSACYVSEIYDQTGHGINLTSTTGEMALYQTSPYNGLPVVQNSQGTIGSTSTAYYRDRAGNSSYIPTGTASSGLTEYYVRSNYALVLSEGDFGDMDSTVSNSGQGARFALGYSAATSGLTGAYYCLDLENSTPTTLTCAAGGSFATDVMEPVSPPSPPLFTLFGKYTYNATLANSLVTIEMADATQGPLSTLYNAAPPQAPNLGGGVSLSEGGNGNLAYSSFQEGVILPSTTSSATDASVQANIAAFYGQFSAPATSSNYQGPGDIVSGANGWWGLRAYNNAAAAAGSNAIELVNQATGATQNIAVTASGDLNAAAAQTFCAGATCTIAIWYDQSGHGDNMTAAATANQAQLLFNCTNQLKVCASFMTDPANSSLGDGYTATLAAGTVSQPYTQNAVFEKTDSGVTGTMISSYNDTAGWAGIGFNGGEVINVGDKGGTQDNQTAHSYVFQSATAVYNGAANGTLGSYSYINGLSQAFAGGTSPTGALLGLGNNSTTNNYMVGYINEIGQWPVAMTAAQSASLTSNQRAYWQF